ncbi:MAG: WYL domain-containing protein [Gammaproteobacteria bacterium]|nr:WYL domain-containing protein [Gammaproteobacteria bacterium]MDE0413214.1 WYL domain-containing protein [Gammaproteobacteria bacterium]
MRRAVDTVFRYLAILQCIPAHPARKTTARILTELRERDPEFNVNARTMQRDLEYLSGRFPITCETVGRTNHWYWIDSHAMTQLPAMTEHTAFALRLANEYLRPLMPPATLRLLDSYFQHANRLLKGSALGRWANRARIVSRGPELMPPPVREDVQRVAYDALLNNRLLEINYRSRSQGRSQPLTLNPLGLVFRETVAYLVASAWDYPDVRHYALHRMSKARLSSRPATTPPGFRLASHIQDELRFSYPLTSEKIPLRVAVSLEVAEHLAERLLSGDQRITRQTGDRVLVEASVADTQELRWWLLGFGSAVEVLSPASLREEFAAQARAMQAMYETEAPM